LGNSAILGVAALFSSSSRGEILTELEETTIFKTRHFVRQISNCKSAQIPSISTVNSSLHTPGNFIDGQQVKHAETIILDRRPAGRARCAAALGDAGSGLAQPPQLARRRCLGYTEDPDRGADEVDDSIDEPIDAIDGGPDFFAAERSLMAPYASPRPI
jgi:hypothetical protein